jgi:hypothetical protein
LAAGAIGGASSLGHPDECAIPLSEVGHATDVDAKDLADAAEWFY